MKAFSALIDTLVYTASRNRKLALIAAYLRETPDPDRGWALAALTGELDFPGVKSSTIRNLMKDRVDPVLWTLSRDFVGDTAETASMLWPENGALQDDPASLSETVAALASYQSQHCTKGTAQAARPAGCQWAICTDQAGDRRYADRCVGATGEDRLCAGVRRIGR